MPQMNTEGTRMRKTAVQVGTNTKSHSKPSEVIQDESEHPAGPVKHGSLMETLRIVTFILYFAISSVCIHGAQLLGAPLYWISRDFFYAYMALTKQYFGLLITTGTQWWSPTVIRISGDGSVAGQLRQTSDGRVECDFPERLVLVANHQIYTDWLYLWWAAYTGGMHGHIYIILKQSLKWVPIIGPAMQFYNFIFMARKWSTDQLTMRHRLQKLSTRHSGPLSGSTGASQLDPMWLLIFPEGTNLSQNTRAISAKWAAKAGVEDMKHTILPRSTGLQFCLQELKGTVDYVYDCTIAYEKIPHGQYGQDIFTLRSVYFQGRPPKSVNMHWRRFKISEIPVDDLKAMEKWTEDRWREKDALLEQFMIFGRFPGQASAIMNTEKRENAAYIETEVRTKNMFELLQMFVPVTAAALLVNVLVKLVNFVLTGARWFYDTHSGA